MRNEWKKGGVVVLLACAVFIGTYWLVMAIAEADGFIPHQDDQTQPCVLIFSSLIAVLSAALLLPFIDLPMRKKLGQKGGN